MSRPQLSLVLPIYNEEPVIPELDRRLREFLTAVGVSWEVVFVNDGSKDKSYEMLRALCAKEPRYKLVSFARNFGHQFAITAGVDYAEGEAVVVMDADLQDPPEVVADMLAKYREGFDVVYGVREKREKEGLFKRATAAIFYRLLRALVGVQIPIDAGDFRLMSRRVVLTMRALKETNRFVRGLVAWVGYKQTAVTYVRRGRFAGETHYPVSKMVRFALDGIISFSTVPLRVATFLGMGAGFLALAVAAWAFVAHWQGAVIPGWTTIIIAVSLAASAQLVMTGILGEYIARIYDEVKRRPLYIVADEVNVGSTDVTKLAAEAITAATRTEVLPAPALNRPADTTATTETRSP
jgi:glycosyltransferase involved in cell wall biosynthesis